MKLSSTYRSDIDALRGLAVLAVVIFHLNSTWMPGGFLGVDVFFVISGFVIYSSIRPQLRSGTFRMAEFYGRRIRRLAPAGFLVAWACLAAGFLLLRPADYVDFAKSLILQPLSGQNFLFLAEGEYFNGSEQKPLLHTWSLAVEEQFYLLFPVTALLLLKLRTLAFQLALTVLILASAALSWKLTQISPKSAFFMLPTRAWELGLGVLAAEAISYLRQRSIDLPYWLAETTIFLLFGALVLSLFLITETQWFPGLVPITPCILTGALLLFAENTRMASVIGASPARHLGKLSYSIYLWHWPPLAFMAYVGMRPDELGFVSFYLLLVYMLTLITTRFFEQPVRQKAWLSNNVHLVRTFAVAGLLTMSLGMVVVKTDGALFRYTPAQRPYLATELEGRTNRCGLTFRILNPTAEVCEIEAYGDTQRILLWGNSHADMWKSVFTEWTQQNDATLLLNTKNCRATPDHDFCGHAVQEAILQEITRQGVTDVVLASTLFGGWYGVSDEVFEQTYKDVVARVAALGVRVWLVVDVPNSAEFDPKRILEKNPEDPLPAFVEFDRLSFDVAANRQLLETVAATHPNVEVIDATSALCDGHGCWSGKRDEVWYHDDNHVTDAGARRATEYFRVIFRS